MSQTRTVTETTAKLNTRTAAMSAAMIVALFGVTLVYGVGFFGPNMLHNAAHDARHATGFPCH